MSKHKKRHKRNNHTEHEVVEPRRNEDLTSDDFNEEYAGEFAPAGLNNFRQAPGRDDDELETKDIGETEKFDWNDRDDTEAAAEVAPVTDSFGRDELSVDKNDTEGEGQGQGVGVVGIIISALAFFLVPFLLGPAGIILGIISIRRGSMLGWWAVGIGAAAILLTAFVAPLAGF
ncbi:hypothetical protein SAMN05444487_101333 [Marininema mesophilum]|uniref:DUF4190 domain-containing protein n=1 Tax=Marininema mesophilum TaxID=1048340 RepID=A0A1H2QYB6_9BACL|nr:hypothetical protein [Marininema mesophilum]SDW12176.1 hypothetical protein SAMN05444487_101333 [Marininema mesophilum]